MQENLENYISQLEEKVSTMFHGESSGHDIAHLKRVYKIALHIQSKEGGDRLVIGTAAFLHDIHRLKEKETGEFFPPKESLPIVKSMLEEVAFPSDKIDAVLHCIEFHEEYGFVPAGQTAQDLETLILQDADNLDAIGALGIGRTFAFSGAYGVPMWAPEIPFSKNYEGEHKRDPSTMHHIYSKLLELKNNMNTQTGKVIAEDRHNFMQEFFDRFIQEWNEDL